MTPVSGSAARATPVGAAEDPGVGDRAAERRRGVEPSHPVLADDLERLFPQFGGEVDHVVLGEGLLRERRRLRGEGLSLGGPFAGDVARRDRAVLDGPDRLAGHPVEDVDEAGLRGGGDRVDLLAVHVDGQQGGRRRQVVVPEAVLHGLEVPDPLAGARVEADDGLREEVVAEAVSAVVVVARRADGEVDEPPFGVEGHRRPDVRVPHPVPGAVLPGVVPELAGCGIRLKDQTSSPVLVLNACTFPGGSRS